MKHAYFSHGFFFQLPIQKVFFAFRTLENFLKVASFMFIFHVFIESFDGTVRLTSCYRACNPLSLNSLYERTPHAHPNHPSKTFCRKFCPKNRDPLNMNSGEATLMLLYRMSIKTVFRKPLCNILTLSICSSHSSR